VAVTGALSAAELDARYGAARVAVAPLRVGAGVKLKVVEALRHGLPLATTPVGAQGLEGLSGVAAVCADADGLAGEIARLLTDDDLWLCRSRRQSAYAEARFSKGAHRTSLDAALAAVGVTLPIASPD
jgi:O-antigen biosynthesis protein